VARHITSNPSQTPTPAASLDLDKIEVLSWPACSPPRAFDLPANSYRDISSSPEPMTTRTPMNLDEKTIEANATANLLLSDREHLFGIL
jgi:hypothetical protein